jgi:hypothetical protein
MQLLKTATLLIGSAAVSFGQGPDVAIVAAASANITDCRFTDTQALLLGTGLFNSVDVFNAAAAAPTLSDLTPYAAIITWANSVYADPVATGDAFADYVDLGGGVVACMFTLGAGAGGQTPLQLQGRWTPTYELVDPFLGQESGQATLGVIHDPTHPIMAGVTSFDGGAQSYRPRMTDLRPGAQAVADWSDGKHLVVVGALSNRVDLTMYPPPSTCRSDFWDVTTDGALLMANALVFAATSGGPGTSYCTPAVPNSSGAPGAMGASGSASVAANSLTLRATELPSNAFGFFLTSQQQASVAQPGGSQGVLCLGGAVGRYVGPGQIQNSGAAGEIFLTIDLGQHPSPTGFVQVGVGETWNFQAWFRDANPGVTSNFTDGLSITFQ